MYEYRVRDVRIIDGDTFEATVDLGFRVSVRETFRMKGINSPEMNTPRGPLAKAYLQDMVTGFWKDGVTVTTEKSPEKYGRWLATIWGHAAGVSMNLNKRMVDDGFAVSYME